jgi:ketosteroid isomerase-like protein
MPATPTVESFVKEWVEAFNSRDLDRHMRLYTEDATLFGSVDALQVGRERIRAYFAERPPGVRVASYPTPRSAEVGPGVIATAGHVEFVNGVEPMPYRMTWILVRHEGGLRIAQHHGSPRTGA